MAYERGSHYTTWTCPKCKGQGIMYKDGKMFCQFCRTFAK